MVITDAHLIEKMRDLKAKMLFVADALDERGNAGHGAELAGAAGILQTWIDGILGEE